MTVAEEVKSRLDIIEVVNEYVPLKPAGANFKARCPFHDERTPSFMVSRSKQIWHCFGCQEGGDIFTFVMKQEGLEFPDALRLLADKAGVRLRAEDHALKSQRQRLTAVLDAAVEFWSSVLWEQPASREARRYLQDERHLLPETVREWRLGFAPDSWEALADHLAAHGFTSEEVVSAGVAVRKMEARGRDVYDRFRNRIVFPIANAQGQLVGVSARILFQNAVEAKYVNTPETLLYRKSAVLYGLDRAKTEMKKQNLAVVVEGNVDVLSSHQAGVKHVVAASGTALTDEQARLLRRYVESVAFSFDADAAGESATLRGLFTALDAGLNVSLITLPRRPDGQPYKDPDECVRADPELWRRAITEARPMMEHYFHRVTADQNLKTLEGKQAAVKLLLPLLARLPDRVAQTHYFQTLSDLVQVPEQYLREALPKPIVRSASAEAATLRSAPRPPAPKDSRTAQSERLLASLLFAPAQAEYVIGAITPEMLSSECRALYRAMVVFYTEEAGHESGEIALWRTSAFHQRLSADDDGSALTHLLAVLTMLADTEFAGLDPIDLERDLISTVTRLKKNHLHGVLQQLERDIRSLEQSSDAPPHRLRALLAEFQAVSTDVVKLDNPEVRP